MLADALARLFAEAVAEEEEGYHDHQREGLREDTRAEEDGVEDAMGKDRCAEDPEAVDARGHRVEAHERIVISHEDAEEHVARNGEEGTGDAGRNPIL